MKTQTFYIAGPMRGYPNYNFDMFAQARDWLRQGGLNAVCPAELDLCEGFNPSTTMPSVDIASAFSRDIYELMDKCDSILMLPGWEKSVGANAELAVAEMLGLQVYKYKPEENTMSILCSHYNHDRGADRRFFGITNEMAMLSAKKQQDYGLAGDPYSNVRASEAFGIPGWVGTLMRAQDKMKRLQKAAQGSEMANESVEDSLIDLANYAVIALILYREINGK